MAVEAAADALARGEEALRSGAWDDARAAFAEALSADGAPGAHDGLGLALWWLRDVDTAIAEREQAYAAFRKRGDLARAARIAMWLAREYLEAMGNEPASRGWLARAEGLLRDKADARELGWLALTRGRRAGGSRSSRRVPGPTPRPLSTSVGPRATPIWSRPVSRLLGLALIDAGEVEAGMNHLDEAMAAATGGEVEDQLVFGDVCCIVTRAAEEAGDVSRLMKWNEIVMTFMERTGHAALLEFCGTCCAEVLVANGQLSEAEGWLMRTLEELEGTGHRARCVHPAAKLAELRLLQGRIEDAERLLAGYEDRADALRAAARLHLAKGETAVAAALLHRRLNQVRGGLLAIPILSLLVQVQLAQGDVAGARGSAERLSEIAGETAPPRQRAMALLALGRTGGAAHDPAARRDLETALEMLAKLEMPLETSEVRLELARLL